MPLRMWPHGSKTLGFASSENDRLGTLLDADSFCESAESSQDVATVDSGENRVGCDLRTPIAKDDAHLRLKI